MALKNQKLDDYLTEQNLEQQFNGGKTSKKVKKEKVKKTKNKKGTAKRVAAFVIAIALAVTAFVSCSIIKKNKNKTNTTPRHPSITQEDNTNNIDNNIENNKNEWFSYNKKTSSYFCDQSSQSVKELFSMAVNKKIPDVSVNKGRIESISSGSGVLQIFFKSNGLGTFMNTGQVYYGFGYKVIKLKRESFGFITLDGLSSGKSRKLTSKEVKQLYVLANKKGN